MNIFILLLGFGSLFGSLIAVPVSDNVEPKCGYEVCIFMLMFNIYDDVMGSTHNLKNGKMYYFLVNRQL